MANTPPQLQIGAAAAGLDKLLQRPAIAQPSMQGLSAAASEHKGHLTGMRPNRTLQTAHSWARDMAAGGLVGNSVPGGFHV